MRDCKGYLRRVVVVFVCLLVGLGSLAFAGSGSSRRPNVVIIITDDQSWDSLGYMGGDVHTPRIDRMAREGLIFSDANVTSTVCSPSRYSFLTGRYAGRGQGPRLKIEHPEGTQTQLENICELEKDGWNVAKALQGSGYTTGFVGKAHLINQEWLGKENWARVGLKTYPDDSDPRDPAVNEMMRFNHSKWCEAIKQYGFDYADGIYGANLKELGNKELFVHNLDWSVSKAHTFIEDNRDNPFFLYFSTTLHHGPAPWAQPGGKFVYGLDADPRMTGEGFVEEGFDVMPSRKSVFKRNAAAGKGRDKAFALWLDDGVGSILDKIREMGIERDTLVIFVSDHGSWRHGKTTLHEYGMKVPLVMYWPGVIEAGSKYDEIVANIDFAPTIMDVCGVKASVDYYMDGVSLKDVIEGSSAPVRRSLFGEMGHSRCVKTKDWKYIAIRYPKEIQDRINLGRKFGNFEGHPPMDRPYLTRNGHLGYYASRSNPHYWETDQLYDLRKGVEEDVNLVGKYPEVMTEMKRLLSSHLDSFWRRPFGEFTAYSDPGYEVKRMPEMSHAKAE